MIKQTFKNYQFILCTLFVLFGLTTIYSPSYGGSYTGAPGGGYCPDTGSHELYKSDRTIYSQLRSDDEGGEENHQYFEIETFQNSMNLYASYRTDFKYREINGEWEENAEWQGINELTISGLQPNTKYEVGITSPSCGMIDVIEVRTEILPRPSKPVPLPS